MHSKYRLLPDSRRIHDVRASSIEHEIPSKCEHVYCCHVIYVLIKMFKAKRKNFRINKDEIDVYQLKKPNCISHLSLAKEMYMALKDQDISSDLLERYKNAADGNKEALHSIKNRFKALQSKTKYVKERHSFYSHLTFLQ